MTVPSDAARVAGNDLFRHGDFQGAADVYLRTLDDPTLDRNSVALLYCNLAACSSRLSRWREAVAHADAALNLEPSLRKAHFRKASAVAMCIGVPDIELIRAVRHLDESHAGAHSVTRILTVLRSIAAQRGLRLPLVRSLLPVPFRRCLFRHGEHPGQEEHMVICLHGFGDNAVPYDRLMATMKIPSSASVSLNGPLEVNPDLLDSPPGFSWFHFFDEEEGDFIAPTVGETRRLESLSGTVEMLRQVMEQLLASGWQRENILFMGFSQGGTAALQTLLLEDGRGLTPGVVVAVAAGCLEESLARKHAVATESSHVLLLHRDQDPATSEQVVAQSVALLRSCGHRVQRSTVSGAGHCMLGSEEEARVLFQFLGGAWDKSSRGLERMVAAGQVEEVGRVEAVELDEMD